MLGIRQTGALGTTGSMGALVRVFNIASTVVGSMLATGSGAGFGKVFGIGCKTPSDTGYVPTCGAGIGCVGVLCRVFHKEHRVGVDVGCTGPFGNCDPALTPAIDLSFPIVTGIIMLRRLIIGSLNPSVMCTQYETVNIRQFIEGTVSSGIRILPMLST